jgi:putative drug exporter of the RND superfamily
VRARLKAATPAGVQSYLTGRDPLELASSGGGSGGPSVLTEALIGGLGALVIVWLLTYFTNVSIIVQFLIALVELGVAIDYALLMIFRFRDELREGEDVETAIVQTMTHAGRSVVVSGSTVAVGLLAMIVLPLPFIRSIGIGGMLIPAVSVIAAITLLPALLATVGTGINRIPVLPKRFLDKGHPEDGAWGRWARFVTARPLPIALAGFAIVGVLVYYGLQLNPSEAQVKDLPGSGSAIAGRTVLADAGISPA